MNPPYGRHIGRWVEKVLAEVGRHGEGSVRQAVLLLPARPDTRWWRLLAGWPWIGIHGRLRFSGQQGSGKFASALYCVGGETTEFFEAFHDLGACYQAWHWMGERQWA